MSEVLQAQAAFDNRYLFNQAAEIRDPRVYTTGKILFYIAGAHRKVLEGTRSEIRRQAVPDLSIARARLVNIHEITRSDMPFPIDGSVSPTRELALTQAALADYLLPALQGGPHPNSNHMNVAVSHLDNALGKLAALYSVDLVGAHLARLEELEASNATADTQDK